MLFPGHACNFPISFTPTTDGSLTGTLAITDNALNSAGPAYTTQTVELSGSGSDGMGGDALPYHPGTGSPFRPEPDLTLPCGHGDSVITEVTPSKWFAGKQYHITVHGTNFLFGTGDGFCLSTLFVQVTNTKKPATVSDVRWVSSTEITATVQLDAHEPTEDLQLSIGCGDPCDFYPGMIYGPIHVLPTPQIQWNGDTISGDNPNAQTAVIGQRIELTSQISPPITDSVTANTWTLDGTTIGGYQVTPPTTDNPTKSSAAVTPTTFNKADLTTYWTSSTPTGAKGFNVKYHYCIAISDISSLDDRNNNCSSDATALFEVSGPTNTDGTNISVDTVKPAGAQPPHIISPLQVKWGLRFPAQVNPPANPAGSFSWIQLVNSYNDSHVFQDGTLSCVGGPGLDTSFPTGTGLHYADGPDDQIAVISENPETRTLDNDVFTAYLMWSGDSDPNAVPNSTSDYIPVALGYVKWYITGDAVFNSDLGVWSINHSSSVYSNGGNTTFDQFVPSSAEY